MATNLERRLDDLEARASSGRHTGCVAFVRPGEDAEQKTKDALAGFVAEHGHHPTVMSTVQFVKPTRRDDE